MDGSIIFINSAPYEIKNTGDFDYSDLITKQISEKGILSQHITYQTQFSNSICGSNRNLYNLSNIANLIKQISHKEIKNNKQFFSRIYNHKFRNDPNRIQFINNVKSYIIDKSQKLNKKPILNIQMRAPQTGFLFLPEDLQQFKQQGIQIIVTCHEYKLLFAKRHLQQIYHPYFIEANMVFFFNKNDLKNAAKHACKRKIQQNTKDMLNFQAYDLQAKSFLTQVPPTTQYVRQSIDSLMNRPPNIISFGMIRQSKGFQEALQIAKYIKNHRKQISEKMPNRSQVPRVIIIGYPSSSHLLREIINTKFGSNVISVHEIDLLLGKTKQNNNKDIPKQNVQKLRNKIIELSYNHKESSPIDLFLDIDSSQMPQYFSQTKYAVKFDQKGWANNASSHISALANGAVLFTGWGIDTDNEVLPKRVNKNLLIEDEGQFYQSIILPKNKYGLAFGQKMTPEEQISQNGKFRHFKLEKTAYFYKKQNLMTAKCVLDNIIQRQNDPKLNQKTLNKANQLFQKKFDPNIVVQNMIEGIKKFCI